MNTRNRHRLNPTQRLTNHNMPVNYTYMTNVLEPNTCLLQEDNCVVNYIRYE